MGDNRAVKASQHSTLVGVAAALLVLLAACSSGDDAKPGASADVPKGFDVPSGVTIAQGGSTLPLHKAASVVYEVEDGATSAITVSVNNVRKGNIKKDFAFFSVDEKLKSATAYYVRLSVRNDGPSGLGGAALPVLAHTKSNTVFPASEMVGDFKPCPRAALPESFLKGRQVNRCLVFLLPKGEKLQTIDLRTGKEADAIHWKP